MKDIRDMEGKIIDTRMNDLRIYEGRCPTLRAQRDGVLYVKNHTIYQLTGYENYDECVTKYSDSFVRVVLDPGYVSRIQNFVTELVEAKSKEDHHKIDSNKEVKRFTTGFLGEAALEKLFGIPIIDWTIGYSGLYHIPDIPGYRVGIKTVERDKFPIIFKDNSYPQIICIKSTKYNNLIFVCGLATSNVLNNYQDDDLILDPNLRARGTKTGFYGFEQLVPIKSLNDLSTYKK